MQRDAVVNSSIPWPQQFCISLYDHTYNGSLVNRTLTYTNREGSLTEGEIEDSPLVDEIMSLVQSTINDFLMPVCIVGNEIFGNFTNVTLEFYTEGEMCKFLYEFEKKVFLCLIVIVIEPRLNEEAIISESNQYQSSKDSWNGEFLGGIIFERNFRRVGSDPIPSMNYTMRLGPEFTSLETYLLIPTFQVPGPGYAGI